MRTSGWIFDAYLTAEGISLWIIDEHGQMHTLLDRWTPRFYAQEDPRLARFLAQTPIPHDTQITERQDFFTHQPRQVLEIRARNPLQLETLVNEIQKIANLELFNCDIHPVQSYHYDRQHFPLAKGEFVHE